METDCYVINKQPNRVFPALSNNRSNDKAMRPRKVPATSLAHSLVVPHTRDTRRLFTRLSKASLIAIAKRWLDPAHVKHFSPNLVLPSPDDEEEFSLEEALEVYDDLARSNAIRAKDVAERMLEVEWRDGASLLGIAELEWQCTAPCVRFPRIYIAMWLTW